jgi:hypothetical protein
MLSQWFWIIVCYAEQWLVVNHGVIWWASGCEPLCTMIHQRWLSITHHDAQPISQYNRQWYTTTHSLNIALTESQPLAQNKTQFTMCYAVPFVVSHCRQCCTSGGESWCAMLCQCCESCCAMLSQWVFVNHGVLFWASGCMIQWFRITNHDLQPLAQYSTPWFTANGTA